MKLALLALVPSLCFAQYDNSRTGANTSETILTPSNVTAGKFGPLCTYSVDGAVWAQPIYVSGSPSLVIITTMHNSVYAFNADSCGPALWSVNLGTSLTVYPDSTGTMLLYGAEIGILSTGVVDSTTGMLYVLRHTPVPSHVLSKIRVSDGTVLSSVTISGQVVGTGDTTGPTADTTSGPNLIFYPTYELQRAPLTLANGKVYIPFTSYQDIHPWHGWVFSYDETSMTQSAIVCTTPTGYGGSIWQAAGGMAVDGSGNLYAFTGNGTYDGTTNFGETIVKYTPSLVLSDWFTPSDYATRNTNDQDVGSGRAMLIPGTNLVAGGTKNCQAISVDSTNMGHLQGSGATPQIFSIKATSCGLGDLGSFGNVFMNGHAYFPDVNGALYSFTLSGSTFTTPANASTASTFSFPGTTISGSSNGALNGIIWATTPSASSFTTARAGTLRAFDASTLTQLYSDSSLGTYAKFSLPMDASGRVYVATLDNLVRVYGLIPALTSSGATKTSGATQGD